MTAPEPLAAYARTVAARVPAADRDDIAAELLDHLLTDYESHLGRGSAPADAIAAALARCGPADQVASGYQREERRHRRYRLAASAGASALFLTAVWAALLVLAAPPPARWPLRPQPAGVAATGIVMLAAAVLAAATVSASRMLTSPGRPWTAHPAADALAPVLNRAAAVFLALAAASAGALTAWRAVAAAQSWMAVILPCAAVISAATLARLTTHPQNQPLSPRLRRFPHPDRKGPTHGLPAGQISSAHGPYGQLRCTSNSRHACQGDHANSSSHRRGQIRRSRVAS